MKTGDKVKYTPDVHLDYIGQVAEVVEFDMPGGMVDLKFHDGQLLWVFWDEITEMVEEAQDVPDDQADVDKLYEALKTVKEYCSAQEISCWNCALYTEGGWGCLLNDPDELPENMNLEFLIKKRNQTIKKDPAAGTVRVSK
ncbi:hypothetical protein [Lacrimispora sp.]|uniref:hypothetical protein n=1 Tax=Lacrimispora sp. TaxID=2719234 RepID=UPI002FD9E7B5